MSGFPVQSAKVQRPPLRDDVLARDRLLDWLHTKIHHRLILVLAEAGYGKTTLLTDFARRTRLRTLWYRMDEDDRDWVTLLHHLVASGREHDPAFAPRTAAMLSDTDVSGPSRETVLETFLRELPSIAEHGAVMILDDFHLVDDAPDARLVVRELVLRAPERISIVIASRRAPSIAVAKLRAAGEVAELRTDDLRFDQAETARLFSETYGRTLEPDVLAELSARTEGWAASLQLVQAALRDRSPLEIRRFIRNLTGADHELYDYLAEEVVGDLPDELQQFLMRTSILQVVTPELAEAATGLAPADVRRLTSQAERFSLLSRRGTQQRDHLRYHPLVRDFLESRLERGVEGREAVATLHRKVAEATEGHDWRSACHHYAQIGDDTGVLRSIDIAVKEIVGRGDVLAAEAHLAQMVHMNSETSHEVILARSELRRGHLDQALQRARAALDSDPTSPVAAASLASIAYRIGQLDVAEAAARRLIEIATDDELRAIGVSLVSVIHASADANLDDNLVGFQRLRALDQASGNFVHEGTTLLNMACVYRAQGNADAALAATGSAIPLLDHDPSSAELASVRSMRAWALAHNAELERARELIAEALQDADSLTRAEVLLEAAETEIWYGSAARAEALLLQASSVVHRYPAMEPLRLSVKAEAALRAGDLQAAASVLDRFDMGGLSVVTAGRSQQLSIAARLAFARQSRDAERCLLTALSHSQTQGATFWVESNQLLLGLLNGTESARREIRRLAGGAPSYLSVQAESVMASLGLLGEEERQIVGREIARRPERWLGVLRVTVDDGGPNAMMAADFLEPVGEGEDVGRLRAFARRARGPGTDLGKRLARRLAARVFVEDQGRVGLRIGERHVEGAVIRRKVLALLCYLLTRPRFSAARDEVLEALWPDFEPTVALNSLNQTIYFLRRVLEPEYREEISPGYVRHESDVVWLDRQLVSSRTQRCADYVRSLPARPDPLQIERLLDLYSAPFALDFAYEEWAVTYRDSLHSAFLQLVETAVASDIETGHFDRGIVVARRALAVDADAEQIELSLLRLLRLSGAHAAAMEQYAHYSNALRNSLGIEAPPLDAL